MQHLFNNLPLINIMLGVALLVSTFSSYGV